MTRDEVLGMKPGRELDALVGKTFHFYYKNEYHAVVDGGVVTWHLNKKDAYEWHEDFIKRFPRHPYSTNGGRIVEVQVYKPYSTDIAATWEVAEGIDYLDVHKYKDRYVCAVYGNKTNRAEGKTVAEAICKAALLAVMEG